MKETFFLVVGAEFAAGFKKNMISPVPLHIAKITEFTAKLNMLNGIIRRGALRLIINSITPLIRPLFSTTVQSAKNAKHEGIPIPNETPNEIEMIKTCVIVKPLNKAGNNGL